MNILRCFGAGAEKIIAGNNFVDGLVTRVKTCRWLKVNTKPARMHALDGAVFPHMIYFSYTVNGTEYKGVWYVSWYISYAARCPQVGERVTVYFDRADPSKYAVRVLKQPEDE